MKYLWLASWLLLAGVADAAPLNEKELARLVIQDCGSCHGLTMQGGLGKPLTQAELQGKPAEVLAEIIMEGVKDTPMPPWKFLLTPEEAMWIANFLLNGGMNAH